MIMEKHLLICLLAVSLSAFGCGDDDDMGVTDSGIDSGTVGFDFRTDAVSAYTQVDRIGMPAISTALIGSAMKDDYNDDTTADDVSQVGTPAAPKWAGEITANLEALHIALADDLAGLGACATVTGTAPDQVADVSSCVGQATGAIPVLVDGTTTPATTVSVGVIPDALTIDATAAPGFPNGRRLADPVMDVTLAVILLDLAEGNTGCGGSCTALTLATGATQQNPGANDKTFQAEFPFVAAPHEAL